MLNPRRHNPKKVTQRHTSTFDTIHPINQIFGTYNERTLYFQLIGTTCCLIGFHGSHNNIMTSLAAAIFHF